MASVITEAVINNDNQTVDVSTFTGKGKKIGIYFSAHWCPPCRGFTPVLTSFYKAKKDAGKQFEIVFVSSDRDESSFMDYFKTMPWLAVPFGSELRRELSTKFEISGIPTLVLIDGETGDLITKDARSGVQGDNLDL